MQVAHRLSVAPLAFARDAVVVAVHLHARTVRQEVAGLGARRHLCTVLPAVAPLSARCGWFLAPVDLRVSRWRRGRRGARLGAAQAFGVQLLDGRLCARLRRRAGAALVRDLTAGLALVDRRRGPRRGAGRERCEDCERCGRDGREPLHRHQSAIGRKPLRCNEPSGANNGCGSASHACQAQPRHLPGSSSCGSPSSQRPCTNSVT